MLQESECLTLEANIRWAEAFILMYSVTDKCSFDECNRLKFLINYNKRRRRLGSNSSKVISTRCLLSYIRIFYDSWSNWRVNPLAYFDFWLMCVRSVNCFSYFEASELWLRAGKEIQLTSGVESCPFDQEKAYISLRLNWHSSLFETAWLLLLLLLLLVVCFRCRIFLANYCGYYRSTQWRPWASYGSRKIFPKPHTHISKKQRHLILMVKIY